MKLAGLVSAGSGVINEDAAGVVAHDGEVVAAWVFDGVTGINKRFMLDVPSEPAWLVTRAEDHLRDVVMSAGDVLDVLRAVVLRLKEDWQRALGGRTVPEGYDLPAACITLAKRVSGRWQVLRLGDSTVLSRDKIVVNHAFPPNDLPDLETELRMKAAELRSGGAVDFATLRETFRDRLLASRRARNVPGSYGILVPNEMSLAMPQIIDLGTPDEILLCTDGYYRAVDTYSMHDDASLMEASKPTGGVEQVLRELRNIEALDPSCQNHPRFKQADDVSAVMLVNALFPRVAGFGNVG